MLCGSAGLVDRKMQMFKRKINICDRSEVIGRYGLGETWARFYIPPWKALTCSTTGICLMPIGHVPPAELKQAYCCNQVE